MLLNAPGVVKQFSQDEDREQRSVQLYQECRGATRGLSAAEHQWQLSAKLAPVCDPKHPAVRLQTPWKRVGQI